MVVIVPTCIIVHPFLDSTVIKDIVGISDGVRNKKVIKYLQIFPICITDAYHNYILDKTMLQYHIK